jgi:hypothetical protein
MEIQKQYFFGKCLLKEFDYFAFPRVGSHFLYYCLSGLFDLIGLPHEHLNNIEAISRQEELNALALYALNLREDGIPYQPVFFNALSNGMHGQVKPRGLKFIVLIREPMAVAYSLYHVSVARWDQQPGDLEAWLTKTFNAYLSFYKNAFLHLAACPETSMLIRFEDLCRDSQILEALVKFLDLRPKLSPDFVHAFTSFEILTRGSMQRTFYRNGDNEAWKIDSSWDSARDVFKTFDFRDFGYGEE